MVPARKGCESGKFGWGWFYGNQVPSSPKEDLMQRKVEHAPRLPKGINTTPWAAKEVWSIHPFIREPPTWSEAPGGSRRPPEVLELPRRWPRPCPSRHGLPCVVKPWWSSGSATWIRQVICTFNILWWYKSILVFTLIYYEVLIHMCSYHMLLVGLDWIMVISLVLRIHRSSARTEVVVRWWISLRSDSTMEEKAANKRVSDHSISGYSISSVILIIVLA
jgi:hypothetical protein